MGDARFLRLYRAIAEARDPAAKIRSLADEDVVAALAGASASHDPYLANVLATEAQNRVRTLTSRAHAVPAPAPPLAPPLPSMGVDESHAERARALGIGRLLDAVHDAVVISDPEGRIVVWSNVAAALFGYTPEEADALNVRDLVPERLRARHDAGMARYRETARGVFMDTSIPLELPALRKDGREIVVEMTLSRLSPEGHVLAVMSDITERVRLSAEVARERERLEHANRTLTESNRTLEAFTYMVSHDLREPVRAVEALLRAVDEDMEKVPVDELRPLVRQAAESNARLGQMLTGLLELARITTADATAEHVVVEDVLKLPACTASYERHLAGRPPALRVEPDIPDVAVPRALFCQIVGNLVGNAVKHNPAPNPLVVLRGAPDAARPGFVEVVVEDNGPGLPPGVLEGLREDADVLPSRSGGFGIVIARRGVERMRGHFDVRRSPLGGAAFHLSLPAAAEAGALSKAPPRSAPERSAR